MMKKSIQRRWWVIIPLVALLFCGQLFVFLLSFYNIREMILFTCMHYPRIQWSGEHSYLQGTHFFIPVSVYEPHGGVCQVTVEITQNGKMTRLVNSHHFRRPNPAYACYPFLEDNDMLQFERQDGLSPGSATVKITAKNCALFFRGSTAITYEIVLQTLPPAEQWPSQDDTVIDSIVDICGNPA